MIPWRIGQCSRESRRVTRAYIRVFPNARSSVFIIHTVFGGGLNRSRRHHRAPGSVAGRFGAMPTMLSVTQRGVETRGRNAARALYRARAGAICEAGGGERGEHGVNGGGSGTGAGSPIGKRRAL